MLTQVDDCDDEAIKDPPIHPPFNRTENFICM